MAKLTHKQLVEAGIPAFCIISQEARKAAREHHPPKAMVIRDLKLEEQRAKRDQLKRDATKIRIAKMLNRKEKPAPIDTTGLRWNSIKARWDQEYDMSKLIVTPYDVENKRIDRGLTSIKSDATPEQLDAQIARAVTRGGAGRVVRVDVTDANGLSVRAWNKGDASPPATEAPPIDQPIAEQKEQSDMAKKAKKATKKAGGSKKVKGAKTVKAKAASNGAVRPGSKLEIIANLLKRKSGCTEPECAKAVGWEKVSMAMQARNAGLKLRKEKAKDGSTRYYGE